MTIITIQLPDELAKQAQQAGLLSSPAMEKLLLEKLKEQTHSLNTPDQDQMLRKDFKQASGEAFRKTWDNDDDAIYDTL